MLDTSSEKHPHTNGSSCVKFVMDRINFRRFVAKAVVDGEAARREVEAHRACGGHPNILPLCNVYDEELPPGHYMRPSRADSGTMRNVAVRVLILVLEQKSCSLHKYIYDRYCDANDLTESELMSIWCQATAAVNHVHTCGYAHLDVKSSNFVVDESTMQIFLIDFGLARRIRLPERVGDTISFPPGTTPPGTVSYLPPDILERADTGVVTVCASTDVWAVGVILMTALLQREPFHIQDHRSAMRMQWDQSVWMDLEMAIARRAPRLNMALRRSLSFDAAQRSLESLV
jgi:serine/threonine protein kinase